MAKYSVYNGKFVCHECKEESHSSRFYPESKDITWICKNKHITKVSLQTRKKRVDHEREV